MENIPSILLMIRQRYPDLTSGEKRVAEYVLTNSNAIVKMRIRDLAQACGVASSAVIRFCKEMGFSGYSEFRFNFSAETASAPEPFMLPVIKRGDGTSEIFNKVFTSNINSMYETIQHLDMKQVEKAVELLRSSSRIVLLGTGTSESVAIDGVYHLMQIGCSVSCATNGVTMRTVALNLTKGETAIGISHCGHTRDTVESLHLAHLSGAATIAITSYKDSPLCEKADVVLNVHSDDILCPTDSAIISARTSHICILDALSVSLASCNYDKSITKIHQRNTIIFPSVRD
ncbi:MAG: MurR/RpiR family transcriptional regulator [Clostridia bacterium]|nr:MurR/RpiR family transcriptional regulator [Clostridia bacterium]